MHSGRNQAKSGHYVPAQDLAVSARLSPPTPRARRAPDLMGQALAKKDRGAGPGRGKKVSQSGTSFRAYLKSIRLDKNRAQHAHCRDTSGVGIHDGLTRQALKNFSILALASLTR